MANLSGFDANQVEPNSVPPPIPAGDYEVIIVESEMKPNSKNSGHFLQLELQVLNGPHQNRKIKDFLNLDNPNDQTVQIAKGTLSAICRAVGVHTPNDSAELHNKPLVAKVVVEKNEQRGPQNKIKGYRKREPIGGGTTVPATPSGGAPAPTANGPAKAPWMRS